jgi:hypothetical protein
MTSYLRLLRPALRGLVAAALALGLAAGLPAYAEQRTFPTPEAAMTALGDAVANNDEATLKTLLGADFRTLIPPADAEIRHRFLTAWAMSHAVQRIDDEHARIAVGGDGWTLPIPLAKSGSAWHFDVPAGVEEMRARRIGRNELAVIQTMLAIYDAQREYAQTDHDGDGLHTYASKLSSSTGKHDGLYWETKAGETPSPLGSAFVKASQPKARQSGYHGYHFKLLTAQGEHAPGGAFDYVANGKLFGGFGVLAWPVNYRDSGIKSFMVSHDGQVYESDLGPDSATHATAIKTFDPGPGWQKVNP